MKLRIIQTLDRHELENQFFSRLPHAIIRVRRPGSRFAKPRDTENCLGRLDLMLHEWSVDEPPYPLPFVKLTSRQALKVAEFVGEQYQHVNQLIVQTEFASSQLTAIAETIGRWTGAFLQRGNIWPNEHQPTKVLLEMAFDAIELAGHRKTKPRIDSSSKDREVRQLIDFVCSLANVTMVSSSRIQECYALTPDRRHDRRRHVRRLLGSRSTSLLASCEG